MTPPSHPLSLPPLSLHSSPTELALDAYQSMRAGFDRLVSLNPPSFSPSSSPSSSSSFSVAPPPSSPPGQRLLEALIQSPSRQLSLQAASASLNLDVSQLVERHR